MQILLSLKKFKIIKTHKRIFSFLHNIYKSKISLHKMKNIMDPNLHGDDDPKPTFWEDPSHSIFDD